MRNAAWISYSPLSAMGLIPPMRQHLALPDIYTAGQWSRPMHHKAVEHPLVYGGTTQGKQRRNMGQPADFRFPRPY